MSLGTMQCVYRMQKSMFENWLEVVHEHSFRVQA